MFESPVRVRDGATRDAVIAGLRRSLENAHPGVSLGWGGTAAAAADGTPGGTAGGAGADTTGGPPAGAAGSILPRRSDTRAGARPDTLFDTGSESADPGPDEARRGHTGTELRQAVGERAARPIGAAILPVGGPLGALLPDGGLPRGGVVGIRSAAGGGGGSSLLLSLVGAVQTGDGSGVAAGGARWAALVGVPEFGLLSAAELGVQLDRLAVVPDPGSDALQVISVLADGVEVIVTGSPRAAVPPARVRVLRGRLRLSGAVLLVAGDWPGADLVITAQASRWSGLGNGHGRLIDRDLVVTVEGRRLGRPRTGVLRFSGRRDGTVAMLPGRPFTVDGRKQQEVVAEGTALPA